MAGVQVGRQLVAGMRSQAENRKILSFSLQTLAPSWRLPLFLPGGRRGFEMICLIFLNFAGFVVVF